MEGKKKSTQRAQEIPAAYTILRRLNGHLNWWPGNTRLEIVVGAILTQNTAWINVEKAIAELKRRRLLSLRALRDVREPELELAIRSSGYFKQKTRKLKTFIDWLDRTHNGSLARLERVPTDTLRNQLLSVWGIGPETADSILLYAFERPVFVIDAYTKRLATRHRWAAEDAGYDTLRKCFTRSLPVDTKLYNDYHAQIVMAGKNYCGPKPKCENCPLKSLL